MAKVSAAGWYPDPQGRAEQRYFDGTNWTEHLVTGGVAGTDAAPPPARAFTATDLYGPGPVASATGYSYGTGRSTARARNAPGFGVVICLVGLGLFAWAVLAQPWIGTDHAMDITVTDPTTGIDTHPAGFQAQLYWEMLWIVLVIAATGLRYQAGKLMGFFTGGCIGLIVCWQPISRDDPSRRMNIVCFLLALVAAASIWGSTAAYASTSSYDEVSVSSGPTVAAIGLVIVAIGALVGRRRVVDG